MVEFRNMFEMGDWVLEKVSGAIDVSHVDCGDDDLNDYFHNDSAAYRRELLTQTYVFHLKTSPVVLAAVDFCNDALPRERMTGGQRRKIAHEKRGFQTFPAVKITRLGVDVSVQRGGIGSVLLEAVKQFFLSDNRTGCRFITVDAYRAAAGFYERNDFVRMLTPETEAENLDSPTIPLFFDLMRMKPLCAPSCAGGLVRPTTP